ncbi:MAG: rod shape-determining protein MreC [Acidimicrobiaceae bacterium]|nr:rod shape-determining protein MreC [Acidimicrobiaceae bacterium]
MSSREYGINRLFVRPRATLLALVLASVTLVTVSYKSQGSGITGAFQKSLKSFTDPIRSTSNSVLHPIENVVSGAFNYSSLKKQNAYLQGQISMLKTKEFLANQLQSEVQALTALANIPFAQGLKTVSAIVDNYSPTNSQMTINIDKGSSAGVKVGQPVVAALGLIGRVVLVTRTSSTILLISDPSSSIGVTLGSSSQVGLAIGTGSFDSMTVNLVDPGTSLYTGEPAYTSGLQGGIYPPNIPVGKVAKYSSTPGALQERVSLAPIVDIAHLQYVKVLDWLPSGVQ